jgi:hypothetical protein
VADQQGRPLWEAVEDACAGNPDSPGVPDMLPSDWAIAFRTIADVVAPEEGPAAWEPSYRLHERHKRQRIRALLLAEAERAEKGE